MRRRVAERQAEVLSAPTADYATNIALTLAKSAGNPAREEEFSRA